jgi:predicted transcriptional regulator
MTLLDRLVRKSVLSRRKVGRAYVYVPEVPRQTVLQAALSQFLNSFFNGSEQELLEFLQQREMRPAAPAPEPREEPRLDTALL